MSCETHGTLVGGYVLGALEPREMEEMRRHLEGCADCAAEARRLAGVPQLLDRIEPADVPPPALRPELEEAVLDRFARERRRERPARRLALRPRAIAALAAGLAVILAVALIAVWPSGDDEGGGGSEQYANVSLDGMAAAPRADGSAKLAAVPAGTKVWLTAWGLGEEGAEYELWCIRADGRWVSGGTFWAGDDGRAKAELTAAVKPGEYHEMVVTRAMAVDGEARGPEVLRGRLRY